MFSIAVLIAGPAAAQDWSQWRGDHRDAKAAEFSAPATWPKELTKKWEVAIGRWRGDAVAWWAIGCMCSRGRRGMRSRGVLNAATGEEIWKDSYASEGTTGGASGFQGPRCSPTVADGKVVTLGVRGILSCYDAATGQGAVAEGSISRASGRCSIRRARRWWSTGLCIAQLGGGDDGGIVAYDMASGEEKWRWTGEGPSNGSPVVMEVRRHEGRDRADGQEPGRRDGGRRQGGVEDSLRAGPRHVGVADGRRRDADRVRARERDSRRSG